MVTLSVSLCIFLWLDLELGYPQGDSASPFPGLHRNQFEQFCQRSQKPKPSRELRFPSVCACACTLDFALRLGFPVWASWSVFIQALHNCEKVYIHSSRNVRELKPFFMIQPACNMPT